MALVRDEELHDEAMAARFREINEAPFRPAPPPPARPSRPPDKRGGFIGGVVI
jgi:hypothetical protein